MRLLVLLSAPLLSAAQFSTSLGDANPYTISSLTTDAAGNTYVVGSRQLGSTGFVGFITSTPSTITYGLPETDVFVSKLDPNGKLLFTDTFAGKGSDTGTAIALDPFGNIYIAGTTTSNDFPLSKPLQNQAAPNNTGFIVKLSNDGTTILYSTYFGGVLGSTWITALATDAKGNLYLTGTTTSADFPHVGNAPNPDSQGGPSGAIQACISAAGDKIVYSGAVFAGPIPIPGGNVKSTNGVGVSVDSSGNAYFAYNVGATVNLPSGFTGYVSKLDPTGKSLSYANLNAYASALAVDPSGDAYVATNSQTSANAPIVVSIEKLDPSANLLWTQNLSTQATTINALALDPLGEVYTTGTAPSGSAYIFGLNATGTKTIFSQSYPAGTVEQSLAIDPSGLLHAAGSLGFVSSISPTSAPTPKIFDLQNAFGGPVTARVSPAELISIYGPNIGPATPANIAPINGFYPTTYAGVQVTINGANIPLLFVSQNQINAVVPMGLVPNTAATIRVSTSTTVTPDFPLWIVPSAPQAFPTVANQDGTTNSQTNPAKVGSIVTFYVTGAQSNFAPLADGQIAITAQPCCQLGGTAGATIVYEGAAPGLVAGVTQINLRIDSIPNVAAANQITYTVLGPSLFTQSVWVTPEP